MISLAGRGIEQVLLRVVLFRHVPLMLSLQATAYSQRRRGGTMVSLVPREWRQQRCKFRLDYARTR